MEVLVEIQAQENQGGTLVLGLGDHQVGIMQDILGGTRGHELLYQVLQVDHLDLHVGE